MGLIGMLIEGAFSANKAAKQRKAKNSNEVETVEVNGLYSLDVPTYLKPTKKLSEDASLQYWSKTLDVSIQVIDESISEFKEVLEELKSAGVEIDPNDTLLDNMANVLVSQMFDLDKDEIGDYQSTTINGLPAVIVNVFKKKTFTRDAGYATLAFVQGRKKLYQIVIIVGGTSITKLSDKLSEVVYSFREL